MHFLILSQFNRLNQSSFIGKKSTKSSSFPDCGLLGPNIHYLVCRFSLKAVAALMQFLLLFLQGISVCNQARLLLPQLATNPHQFTSLLADRRGWSRRNCSLKINSTHLAGNCQCETLRDTAGERPSAIEWEVKRKRKCEQQLASLTTF